MSYVQVAACGKCGAPIYQPSVWMGILSPSITYSCGCFPKHQAEIQAKNPKVDIIKSLLKFQEDTTNNVDYAAFEKVIEWLINCTPEYKE